MKFEPKTEQELEVASLLEPGIYPFQVTQSTNEISKNGREMIKLGLSIFAKDGSIHFMFDYLLEAMAFKLRHFCSYSGLIAKYQSGQLSAEDCLGKNGNLEIIVQDGKAKEDGGKYPSRNAVKDYVAKPINEPVKIEDEDVPF